MKVKVMYLGILEDGECPHTLAEISAAQALSRKGMTVKATLEIRGTEREVRIEDIDIPATVDAAARPYFAALKADAA